MRVTLTVGSIEYERELMLSVLDTLTEDIFEEEQIFILGEDPIEIKVDEVYQFNMTNPII